MKILNIWEIGGDSCIVGKILRQRGHSFEIMKRDGYDPFRIMEYYGEKTLALDGYRFLKECVKSAKKFDVIHVHDIFKIVPIIKKKYPDKKIILHYHGSKLRNTPTTERDEAERLTNKILVSMKELLEYDFAREAYYAPNPIDTNLFIKKKKKNNKGLIFLKLGNTHAQIEGVLEKNNIEIDFESRIRLENPIKYSEMPNILSNYEMYLDIYLRDEKIVPGISNTALQAMAMGLNVLTYDLQFRNKLPDENIPTNVADFMEKLYSS